MYTTINFKTKKQLKEAVAKWNAYSAAKALAVTTGPVTVGAMLASQVRPVQPVTVYQPNDMFGNPKAAPNYTGKATVEGPHYPEAHNFYAEVELVNGVIVKVK